MKGFFMRIPFFVIAILIAATQQAAAWSLDKGPSWVVTQERSSGRMVDLRCSRGAGKALQLTMTGQGLPAIRNVMFWITAGDGRTTRIPVDVDYVEQALVGRVIVSGTTLDAFGNGARFEITAGGTSQVIFQSGMKGTGAARLAMRERCGF